MEIINFSVYVNRAIVDELTVKKSIIKSVEIYSELININQIVYFIGNETKEDFFKYSDPIYESLTTILFSDPELDREILKDYGYTVVFYPDEFKHFHHMDREWKKLIK